MRGRQTATTNGHDEAANPSPASLLWTRLVWCLFWVGLLSVCVVSVLIIARR